VKRIAESIFFLAYPGQRDIFNHWYQAARKILTFALELVYGIAGSLRVACEAANSTDALFKLGALSLHVFLCRKAQGNSKSEAANLGGK
jgi:hypothetical protein